MNIRPDERRALVRARRSKPLTDVVGIDQSLSNCAMVHFNGTLVVDRCVFHTGCTSTKEFKAKLKRGDTLFGEYFESHEMQVAYIVDCVIKKIAEWNPKTVALEGLAFGASGKTERQLAGVYFSIITELHYQLGYDILNGDVVIVTPTQAKKVGREMLPESEQYLNEYTTRGVRKLKPMSAKKDMIEAVQYAGYGYVLDGYTRKSLVASRKMETGIEDLPDAICIGLHHLYNNLK